MHLVPAGQISMGEFAEIGERVVNMERMYDMREGFAKKDDTLTQRLLSESTFSSIEMGIPQDEMLPRTYSLRGWDEDGTPKAATLERLSIKRWMYV